ncbi:hypothetical protein EYF80_015483 [Liparis tanakae]|uniref:Uncharacterized protein n=1 Tax=Liparis tanakae TaxID=230148 RepID=A0A4Z2I8N9_9TELE|nr:hypothetical protein EYF80_015483 [Liparis tanakae]
MMQRRAEDQRKENQHPSPFSPSSVKRRGGRDKEQRREEETKRREGGRRKRLGHQIDQGPHLPELPGVLDVGPGAERQQRRAHHQVGQRRHGAQAHEARQPGHHVGEEHEREERGWRARRVEDVFALVVLGEVGVGVVQLRLQLALVALAEVVAAHFLHGAEETHRVLAELLVAALQVGRRDVRLVPPAGLRTTAKTA